jgi:hypothetical protein
LWKVSASVLRAHTERRRAPLSFTARFQNRSFRHGLLARQGRYVMRGSAVGQFFQSVVGVAMKPLLTLVAGFLLIVLYVPLHAQTKEDCRRL